MWQNKPYPPHTTAAGLKVSVESTKLVATYFHVTNNYNAILLGMFATRGSLCSSEEASSRQQRAAAQRAGGQFKGQVRREQRRARKGSCRMGQGNREAKGGKKGKEQLVACWDWRGGESERVYTCKEGKESLHSIFYVRAI